MYMTLKERVIDISGYIYIFVAVLSNHFILRLTSSNGGTWFAKDNAGPFFVSF